MSQKYSVVATAALLLGARAASAWTVNVGFFRVEPHNSNVNPAGQFNVAVSDVAGHPDQVRFKFTNLVGIQSSISEIYYDDRSPLQLLTLINLTQQGCSFSGGGANPGNLPGGNNLSPAFQAISSFSADAVGNPAVGIDTATDYLTMKFSLRTGATFATVVNALNTGSLRIGMHVRNIGPQCDSDSFVDGGGGSSVVPLPLSSMAGGLGLLSVAALRRRARR